MAPVFLFSQGQAWGPKNLPGAGINATWKEAQMSAPWAYGALQAWLLACRKQTAKNEPVSETIDDWLAVVESIDGRLNLSVEQSHWRILARQTLFVTRALCPEHSGIQNLATRWDMVASSSSPSLTWLSVDVAIHSGLTCKEGWHGTLELLMDVGKRHQLLDPICIPSQAPPWVEFLNCGRELRRGRPGPQSFPDPLGSAGIESWCASVASISSGLAMPQGFEPTRDLDDRLRDWERCMKALPDGWMASLRGWKTRGLDAETPRAPRQRLRS